MVSSQSSSCYFRPFQALFIFSSSYNFFILFTALKVVKFQLVSATEMCCDFLVSSKLVLSTLRSNASSILTTRTYFVEFLGDISLRCVKRFQRNYERFCSRHKLWSFALYLPLLRRRLFIIR